MQARRCRLNLVTYTTNMIFTKIKPAEKNMIRSVFMIFKTFPIYEVVISISLNFNKVKYNAVVGTPPPSFPSLEQINVNRCILKVDSPFQNQ